MSIESEGKRRGFAYDLYVLIIAWRADAWLAANIPVFDCANYTPHFDHDVPSRDAAIGMFTNFTNPDGNLLAEVVEKVVGREPIINHWVGCVFKQQPVYS